MNSQSSDSESIILVALSISDDGERVDYEFVVNDQLLRASAFLRSHGEIKFIELSEGLSMLIEKFSPICPKVFHRIAQLTWQARSGVLPTLPIALSSSGTWVPAIRL